MWGRHQPVPNHMELRVANYVDVNWMTSCGKQEEKTQGRETEHVEGAGILSKCVTLCSLPPNSAHSYCYSKLSYSTLILSFQFSTMIEFQTLPWHLSFSYKPNFNQITQWPRLSRASPTNKALAYMITVACSICKDQTHLSWERRLIIVIARIRLLSLFNS